MKIVKATPKDLVEVLFLLKECVSDLNFRGLKHWNNAYPGSDAMIQCIKDGVLHLYKDIGITKGMIAVAEETPKDYNKVEWTSDDRKILYIQYLAVHPNWQKKGIAKILLGYVEQYAKEKNYSSMRIDMYGGLDSGDKLCENAGFNKAGQFHTTFQSTPYLAYEKGL